MRKLALAGASVLAIVAGLAPAFGADLPRRAAVPYKAPPVLAPVFTWTGFYVGINGGGGWGRSSVLAPFSTGRFDTSGGMVGGTVGYNWQAGPAVWGAEADLDWSDIKGSAPCAGTTCSTRNHWLSTVRGRLGWDAGRFMPYITGGLALGDIRTSIAGVGSGSSTKAGWTVGGGIEAAIAGPWSVKLEYLYADLGRGGNIAGTNSSFRENLVRAGINYRF